MPYLATGPADIRDIFVEAVNAKDPDMFTLADVAVPDEMIDRALEVMERWPRLMLSRGGIGLEPVAVIWVPDDDDRYTPVGHVMFAVEDGAARFDVVDGPRPGLIPASLPAGIEAMEPARSEIRNGAFYAPFRS